MSKVYFPRLVILLSSVGSRLVDLAVSTGMLLVVMLWYGCPWTWHLAAAPVLILAVIFTSLGVGTLLSALTVAYRDFTHVSPFLVQIWMYVMPIVFPVSVVPARWRWTLYLNFMTGLVEGFRSAFLGKPCDVLGLGASFLLTVVVLVVAVLYFEKVERRFADII